MPKPIEEAAPDYRTIFEEDNLNRFAHLMERRIAAAETIKELEEEKKHLDLDLTAMMTDQGAPKINYNGRPVALVQGSRSSLSKEKLLLAGVAATTIQAATVENTFTYLLVGKAK